MKQYEVTGKPVGGKKNGQHQTVVVRGYSPHHAAGIGIASIKHDCEVDTVHIVKVQEYLVKPGLREAA